MCLKSANYLWQWQEGSSDAQLLYKDTGKVVELLCTQQTHWAVFYHLTVTSADVQGQNRLWNRPSQIKANCRYKGSHAQTNSEATGGSVGVEGLQHNFCEKLHHLLFCKLGWGASLRTAQGFWAKIMPQKRSPRSRSSLHSNQVKYTCNTWWRQ